MLTDKEREQLSEFDGRAKWLGARILEVEAELAIKQRDRDTCRKMLKACPNDKCAAAIVDETEGQIKTLCFELVDLREEYYDKIIRVADFVRDRAWDCE